jgi:hypothetical protein
MFPGCRQINTVHTALVERWKLFKEKHPTIEKVHFCCVANHEEDFRLVSLYAHHLRAR